MPLFFLLQALTVASSYIAVGMIIRWTKTRGILDLPNDRSSHIAPTPRGGGAAIVLIMFLAVGHQILQRTASVSLELYLAGAIAVALVSFLDDIRGVSFFVRLLVHFGAAVVALVGLSLSPAGQTTRMPLGLLAWLILGLWVVGLTNAYNFMDGIDGIAGVQAVVGGMAWAMVGLLSSDALTMAWGSCLAAATVGFLIHNWHPASIFMGDVASAFIGFTFAVLPLVTVSMTADTLFKAALIMWPFVFDSSFTFLRRLVRGQNVFAAHRTHLYQRLVITGLGHAKVSLLYGFLACIGGASAIAVTLRLPGSTPASIALVAGAAAGLWLFTRRREELVKPAR